MFDVNPVATTTTEVTLPGINGQNTTLTLEFKYLPRDKRKAFHKRLNKATEQYQKALNAWLENDEKGDEPQHSMDDTAICKELLVNIEGLSNKGEPVAYSYELLESQLMHLDLFADRLGDTLKNLIWGDGYLKALEKNSPAPATTG